MCGPGRGEETIKLTYNLLKNYSTNLTNKWLYAKEMDVTKWRDDSAMVIALKDSGKVWDTDFLHEDKFSKASWINPWRENKVFEKYSDFLNKLLSIQLEQSLESIKTTSKINEHQHYTLEILWKTCDLEINDIDKAQKALEVTHKILSIYKRNGKKLDFKAKVWVLNHKDLELNDWFLNNTTYLTEEKFRILFWKQDINKYADFLNQVKDK